RPLTTPTLSKDRTLLGLGRDRHQPLTRVRTGIDDLAINQILHTLNLRNSERVILGTRLISERHILRSNLHRLRRLTRITRIRVLTIGAELMRPLSSSTLSKDITLHSLGRDRHQPLTRVRTGIDDLAINQILHTLNLRNSERVILGTRLISERHILRSNLHRLRRLTRFTRLQASQILKPGHGELFTLFSHVVLHHVVRDRSILGSNQNILQRHITFTKIGKVRTLPTKSSGVLNVQQFNPLTGLLDVPRHTDPRILRSSHINPSMRRPSHIDFKRHILRISLSNQDLPCRHLLTIVLIRSCELLVMVMTKELLKPRINSTLTKTIHRLSSSQRVLIGINTR